LLDENCTTSSFVQFPFLTTPESWALFVINGLFPFFDTGSLMVRGRYYYLR
jgi:hypothetical protein